MAKKNLDSTEKEKNPIIYVILGYIAWALVFTYPLIFKFRDYVMSGPHMENHWTLWSTWWFREAIINNMNPLFTQNIFYPVGVNMAYSGSYPLFSIIGFLFQPFLSLTVIYNLMIFFSIILSAIGTYLLVKYLTKHTYASFIAGLVFGFTSWTINRIPVGHLELLNVQFIPFFVLYLIKTFKEKNVMNPIFASIFLFLSCIGFFYNAVFLMFFIIIFLLFMFITNRKGVLNKYFIKRFCLMILLFSIMFLPFVYPLLKSGPEAGAVPFSVKASADVGSFFTPSEYHTVFGKYVKDFRAGVFLGGPTPKANYIGFSILFLIIYAIAKVDRKKTGLWIVAGLIFILLSLGPILQFFGVVTIPTSELGLDTLARNIFPGTNERGLDIIRENLVIPLPYTVLHFIPFVNVARDASRFFVMALLCFSVLVGFACKNLFENFKDKKLFNKINIKNLLMVIIPLIIFFEFMIIPIPHTQLDPPMAYEQIISDTEDYAIFEVPFHRYFEYMYYQTFHNKKLVNGMIGRTPESSKRFIKSVPFLELLSKPILINETEMERQKELSQETINTLKDNNIKYVIFHKTSLHNWFMNETEAKNTEVLLDYIFEEPHYEDEEIIIYQTDKD